MIVVTSENSAPTNLFAAIPIFCCSRRRLLNLFFPLGDEEAIRLPGQDAKQWFDGRYALLLQRRNGVFQNHNPTEWPVTPLLVGCSDRSATLAGCDRGQGRAVIATGIMVMRKQRLPFDFVRRHA